MGLQDIENRVAEAAVAAGRAASDMGALSVNWSYSDRAGNIGYVQSTPIPLRRHDTFFQTLDGADPANHWAGFVAPQQRPFALNPRRGWLAARRRVNAPSKKKAAPKSGLKSREETPKEGSETAAPSRTATIGAAAQHRQDADFADSAQNRLIRRQHQSDRRAP